MVKGALPEVIRRVAIIAGLQPLILVLSFIQILDILILEDLAERIESDKTGRARPPSTLQKMCMRQRAATAHTQENIPAK
jgi:hypothetical protein